MAKKKEHKEVVGVGQVLQEVEYTDTETVEEVIVQEEAQSVEAVIETIEVIEPPVTETPKYEFKDTDIVLFENNQGVLKYAPYKYITKRGYKAIELYKSKK